MVLQIKWLEYEGSRGTDECFKTFNGNDHLYAHAKRVKYNTKRF